MSEPIFSVLTGKAQSCDSTSNAPNCNYCSYIFTAPRDYGYFTVSGANIIEYRPSWADPEEPPILMDINGTYAIDLSYQWVEVYRQGLPDWIPYAASIDSYSGDIFYDAGGNYPMLWTGGVRSTPPCDEPFPENLFAPRTYSSYTANTSLAPEFIITGPSPTVTFHDTDPTNKNDCISSEGFFWRTYDNWTQNRSESVCIKHTLCNGPAEDPCQSCQNPPSITGNWTIINSTDTFSLAPIIGMVQCCDNLCTPPYYDGNGCLKPDVVC